MIRRDFLRSTLSGLTSALLIAAPRFPVKMGKEYSDIRTIPMRLIGGLSSIQTVTRAQG